MYKRPYKRQSAMADKFDRMFRNYTIDKAIQSNPRHDLERERLSAPAQFNCEGCG